MDFLGKERLIKQLREEADEIREWMYENSSPDTPLSEFVEKANRYAIICTKVTIIEKQW